MSLFRLELINILIIEYENYNLVVKVNWWIYWIGVNFNVNY